MIQEGRREKELAKQDIKFSPIENDERFELAGLLCVCVCVCVCGGRDVNLKVIHD